MSTLYVNSAWTDEAAFNADANKPAGAVWGTDAFASFVVPLASTRFVQLASPQSRTPPKKTLSGNSALTNG